MTTYTGGCHCGQIAFEVDAEIAQVIDCNCSMCAKRGGLLAFVPVDQLRLKTSATQLATYTFNKHKIQHHFCSVCGIAPLGRGSDRGGDAMWAINVRCLDDVDLKTLEIQHYDGLSA